MQKSDNEIQYYNAPGCGKGSKNAEIGAQSSLNGEMGWMKQAWSYTTYTYKYIRKGRQHLLLRRVTYVCMYECIIYVCMYVCTYVCTEYCTSYIHTVQYYNHCTVALEDGYYYFFR